MEYSDAVYMKGKQRCEDGKDGTENERLGREQRRKVLRDKVVQSVCKRHRRGGGNG